MTQAIVRELLNRMEAFEAKATILQEEAKAIRKMLTDIMDPQNKRSQAAFKRALEDAEIQAQLEVVFEKKRKRLQSRNRKA